MFWRIISCNIFCNSLWISFFWFEGFYCMNKSLEIFNTSIKRHTLLVIGTLLLLPWLHTTTLLCDNTLGKGWGIVWYHISLLRVRATRISMPADSDMKLIYLVKLWLAEEIQNVSPATESSLAKSCNIKHWQSQP